MQKLFFDIQEKIPQYFLIHREDEQFKLPYLNIKKQELNIDREFINKY